MDEDEDEEENEDEGKANSKKNMATKNLTDACEAAFLKVLADGYAAAVVAGTLPVSPALNLYGQKDVRDRRVPCAIVLVDGESKEEEPLRSGNFWMTVRLAVKGFAVEDPAGDPADPKGFDVVLAATLFDLLTDGTLAARLNATGEDFTVFEGGVFFSAPQSGRDKAGVWVDELPVRLYCCNSRLD